jgi:methylated-DNA-[protein]-cysteine S-methyltransferase
MTVAAGETAAISYRTSFGDGWVAFAGDDVVELGLPGACRLHPMTTLVPDPITQLTGELTEYWRGGELPDLPEAVLRIAGGTPLTEAIYRWVSAIPAGTTMTYGEVAAAVGRPRAARAVGAAMAANRFAPLIPCHRLVGSDGSLRGYAGGLEMKRYLIAMEAGAAHG